MCGSLRVTKQQMRDFIAGKTLHRTEKTSEATQQQQPSGNLSQSSQGSFSIPQSTIADVSYSKTKLVGSIGNPYAKITCALDSHQKKNTTTPSGIASSRFNPVMTDVSNQRNPHLQEILKARPQTAASSRPQSSQPRNRHAPTPKLPTNMLYDRLNPQNQIPFQAGPVPINSLVASNWIYPVDGEFPVRDYQLEISQTAILHNTLVSLPTGLGKTLIAAVVLYNYYRWFPSGKVVFLAPTLPLVHQQIQACYNIMGIPATDTAVLTGRVIAGERSKLWSERRVFFCTPQTVEKDITAGRCDATRIVCIVLDEAHKASGNYAYTKVVEQIEAAGAKFRILGLSATPGGEIKAIQKLVDALRIGKIEARMDDDESVKKYIHERHNEIIVVQQGSAVTTIERLLNNVIAPLLERLRNNNGLAMIRGNATLTQFCLIKAKQEYTERTGDRSLDIYFLAAQKLVGIRTDVRRIGIGVARQKLLRIRDEDRTGLMSNVVKSKDFQELMAHVLRSSSNPDDSQETEEDRKLNNPKLMKLDEILKEHFARSKACGESSRAIVFSQWRDSVSEIVAVLTAGQPLLRPRHFVGQGKSGGKSDDKKSLNGMKQKEQQQVMMDFQNGTFNILVCTSIGEEGLDIGEVDLIVNFDTLRSPIRMIQRVGRTGRKRDGRVVCLVSEGAEQKTMIASKQAERTLGRALRRQDAFTLLPSPPLFSQHPVLMKNDMSITATLHMSQVGGLLANAGSREKVEVTEKNTSIVDRDWKLTEEEENKRMAILGPISSILLKSTYITFPDSLRRQLFRGRDRSFVRLAASQGHAKEIHKGASTTSKILSCVEIEHGNHVKRSMVIQSSRLRKSRAASNEVAVMNNLFPLQKEEANATSIQKVWTQPSFDDPPFSEHLGENVCEIMSVPEWYSTSEVFKHASNTSTQGFDGVQISNLLLHDAEIDKSRTESNNSIVNIMRLPTPEPSSDSENEDKDLYSESFSTKKDMKNCASSSEQESINTHLPHTRLALTAEKSASRTSETPSTQLEWPTSDPSSAVDDIRIKDYHVSCCNKQSLSTGVLKKCTDTYPRPVQRHALSMDSISHDTRTSTSSIQLDKSVLMAPEDESPAILQLPPQDSSSDDESDGDDHKRLDVSSLEKRHGGCSLPFSVSSSESKNYAILHTDALMANESPTNTSKCTSIVNHCDTRQIETHAAYSQITRARVETEFEVNEQGHEVILLEVATTPIINSPALEESIDDDSIFKPSRNCRSNVFLSQASPLLNRFIATVGANQDLVDTPNSVLSLELTDTPLKLGFNECIMPNGRQSDDLDLVCSVCYCGDVTDSDPIVLCDGPGAEKCCDLAVHVSCYSIKESLDSIDEWQCDRCDPKNQKLNKLSVESIEQICGNCKKSDGVLKLVTSEARKIWIHPYCLAWGDSTTSTTFCDICCLSGAVSCHSELCKLSVHAHCGLAANSPSSWRIIQGHDQKITVAFCSNHADEANTIISQMGLVEVKDFVKCIILPSSRYPKKSNQIAEARNTEDRTSQKRKRWKRIKCYDLSEKIDKADISTDSAMETKLAKKARIEQRLQERHNGMLRSRFIETEAVDSDTDADHAEEEEARKIEEEEFNSSFINDSSQLEYTQDELDRVDLYDDVDASIHRKLDAEDARKQQFATPILNRRMVTNSTSEERQSTSSPWTESPVSDSQRGLGGMHFIRSVLEHHRNGGDGADIEQMYREISRRIADENKDDGGSQEDHENHIIHHVRSDTEEHAKDNRSPGSLSAGTGIATHFGRLPLVHPKLNSVGGLSAEQKALMEHKRQVAFQRRLQASQKCDQN